MTSPQPVANHRPPPLPVKPEPRPRTALRLNLEGGQLKKRIDLFEGLQNGKDESPVEETNNGLRCRQPRVISPDQKRWTQLDVTNEEPGKRKEVPVSRQRHGQHTMHPGHKRSPMSPVAPKPMLPPRKKVEIKEPVPVPLVNGKPVNEDKKRERPLTGDARAKREESVRNSVLALVSAFEHGKSSVAVERKSKMVTVPEDGRSRTNSESSTSPNGTMSLTRNGADGLMPPPTMQKNRMSRSMDSLMQEFETVAFDLSRESSSHRSTGSSSSCSSPDPTPRGSTRHRSAGDSSPDPSSGGDFRLRIPSPNPTSWKNSRRRRADDHSPDPQHRSNTRHENAINVPSDSRGYPRHRVEHLSPDPSTNFRHRNEVEPFPVFEVQNDTSAVNSLTVPIVQINAGNRTMDDSQHNSTSQSDDRHNSMDDTTHDFTNREHPRYTNVDISPSDPIPHKPVRTYQQDVYNESKVSVTSRDEDSQKLGVTLTKPDRTLEADASEKRKVLRLKQSLSNAAALKVERSPMAVPRTKSARRADGSPEYYQINPDDLSRNCNHNGGMEDNVGQNGYPRFEEASDVTPKQWKNGFDPLVIDNNNQSSFLTKLKSPVSRKPRVSSPSLPPSPSPVPQTKASQPPSLPQAPPRKQPLTRTPPSRPMQPPRPNQPPNIKIISPEIVAKERARLLSPPTSPSNNSGCTSPETQRRLTDSALIPSLSPPSHRKHVLDASPIVGEYAEPVNVIKRSLSDESLATLRRPSPIVDMEGYSVPGSHLWESPKFHTMKPKPVVLRRGKPPKLPNHSGVERSGDRSWNGCTQEMVVRSTKDAGVSDGNKKEGGFRQRSKLMTMRRKINDAFRRKHHHQKTEEDRISVTSEGSDSEVNEQVLKKRLTYVRAMRLRSSVYCTMQPRWANQYSKLYEYAVIVSLKINPETRRYEPYEMKRFPHEVSDSQTDKLRAIPEFCFPDAFKWATVEQYNSESFCFVLTSSDGSRLYGYNRRILPPGKGPRLPEVVCVMSPIGCYPIYNQLLDEIEIRRKHSMSAVENLLKLAYDCPFPRPGSHIKVATPPNNNRIRKHLTNQQDPKPLILQRPQDQRLEHVDFDTLFNCLSVNRIVQIFASLLLERRVVMCSGKLSKLSRCSQALVGLLYPFAWQHVYVPVLPEKLIDMCCSPTPYIMGMLSLCIPRLEEMPLEEVLVVDLDARDFYTVVGDEETILPKKLSAALERALKVCSMSSWEGADTDDELSEDHESKNSAISEAFIRFFVETVGHYSNHFTQQYDGSQKFDRESFIKAVSSKSVRNFLEVFSETQMFSLFIQEKESESEGISQGLFERRVREFENESKSNSKNIGAKMKKFGKAVKEIKDSGLKLAESAKTAQKRMKQNFEDRI